LPINPIIQTHLEAILKRSDGKIIAWGLKSGSNLELELAEVRTTSPMVEEGATVLFRAGKNWPLKGDYSGQLRTSRGTDVFWGGLNEKAVWNGARRIRVQIGWIPRVLSSNTHNRHGF
jgi:hypothetical protein